MIPAESAEPIEMAFGLWTRMGPRNHVLDAGLDSLGGEGQLCGLLLVCCKGIENIWHIHTYTFSSPFSRTSQVSQYQKGKINLDFTEARDVELLWHQLGHMQVCTSLQTDNNTSTPPLSFLQARCPSCRPTNRIMSAFQIFSVYAFSAVIFSFSRWQQLSVLRQLVFYYS